jgi:hypothetical protein
MFLQSAGQGWHFSSPGGKDLQVQWSCGRDLASGGDLSQVLRPA